MEPIIITLYPGGQYKEEKPHEGEEFGYVLARFNICPYRRKEK